MTTKIGYKNQEHLKNPSEADIKQAILQSADAKTVCTKEVSPIRASESELLSRVRQFFTNRCTPSTNISLR